MDCGNIIMKTDKSDIRGVLLMVMVVILIIIQIH